MFPLPDYAMRGTIEELAKDLSPLVRQMLVGWNETKTTTFLVEVLAGMEYRIHVWNRLGVRDEFAALLKLRVRQL